MPHLLLYPGMVSFGTLFDKYDINNIVFVGMVFMSSSALDWRPIVKGWLATISPSYSDVLWDLFDSVYQVNNLLPTTFTV